MSKITEAINTLQDMLVKEQAELIVKFLEEDLKNRGSFAAIYNALDDQGLNDLRLDWQKVIVRVLNDR